MKSVGLATPLRDAEQVLRYLTRLRLIDHELRFARTDVSLMIPLVRELSQAELSELANRSSQASIVEMEFHESAKMPKSLREACSTILPPDLLLKIPRSYDAIGDIAVLELDDELMEYSKSIGEWVMTLNPHLRLVVRKIEATSGQFRTRKVDAIAGHGNTETVHSEFSCKYRLDVNSVYFNPRLSHERMRVAEQVTDGENVIDMFAGVGPYSILIAKTQPTAKVSSIDLNPAAFKYLKENTLLNKVADRVSCYLGDSRKHASIFGGVADRVIMNLPSNSSEFVDVAASLLKPEGGRVHYYTFTRRGETIQDVAAGFRSLLKKAGRVVESFTFQRVLKEVSPTRVQVVLDSRVK